MKFLKFLAVGIFFGIVMYKSEAASWFRIYEMFHFASFHMYGIIGSAVIIGVIGVQYIKRKDVKTAQNQEMHLTPKKPGIYRYLIGGTIFGLGWALTGACPGPMFVLAGAGFYSILVVIAGSILGTLAYGLLHKKLPH